MLNSSSTNKSKGETSHDVTPLLIDDPSQVEKAILVAAPKVEDNDRFAKIEEKLRQLQGL